MRYQIIAVEHGRDAIEYVVPGFFDVVRRQILKRQHPLHVQIARARDEILFVRVLGGQLVANQMTTVIKILPIHDVILYGLPSRRLDLSNRAALFRGHEVKSDVRVSRPATA